MQVVINKCYGGFGLSKKATELLAEQGNEKAAAYLRDNKGSNYWSFDDIRRDDPLLIEVVELLGEEANGGCAELSIEEYDFDIKNFIKEYDGMESLEIPYGYR